MAIDSRGKNPNPLDDFSTYTCHTILAVASSTEGVRALQSEDGNSFDSSIFENTNIKTPLSLNGNDVYIVIDSRKNSQFSIKDINYTSLITNCVPTQTQVIGGTVKMQVHDPFGPVFLNYIQWICDTALNADFSGLTWLLKTIFVGHHPDGTSELVSTSDIRMQLVDIDTEFNELGGNYGMTFVPTSAGSAHANTQSAFIGHSATTVKSDANRTLLSVINDFQSKMNKELDDYYEKVKIESLPASSIGDKMPAAKTSKGAQVGKKVQYMFTLPEEWEATFVVDAVAEKHEEKNWKNERAQKDNPNKPPVKPVGPVTIALNPSMTVEDALVEIFKHCDQIHLQAGNNTRVDAKGKTKIWKTVSSTTSDDQTYCLHWDVVEYTLPNINTVTNSNRDGSQTKTPINAEWFITGSDGEKRPKNSLEFDYFYTGKNTDILHFDMKLKNVGAFLTAGTNNLNIQQRLMNKQQNNIPQKDTKEKTNVAMLRKNTPLFLPSKTKDQINAFSYMPKDSTLSSKARQEYLKTVSDFSVASSLDVHMTIRGNPALMGKTLRKLAPHPKGSLVTTSNNSTATEYKTYVRNMVKDITQNANTSFEKDFSSYPLLVKVNIKVPNVDFSGKQFEDADFAVPFWYDKYYLVLSINNVLRSDGNFRQELRMIAYDNYETPATKEGVDKK